MQSQKIKLEPNDINLVTAGRTVYLQNCASCHGIQLEGQRIGVDAIEATFLLPP